MAFRKIVRNHYEPPMFHGGFAEPKMVPQEDGSGVSTLKLKDVSPSDLCKESLPVFGLDVIKSSGKVISGDVSFAPNDPTIFNDVQDAVGAYVSRVKPVPNEKINSSTDSSSSSHDSSADTSNV